MLFLDFLKNTFIPTNDPVNNSIANAFTPKTTTTTTQQQPLPIIPIIPNFGSQIPKLDILGFCGEKRFLV